MSGFNNTMNMEKEKGLLKFEENLKKRYKDTLNSKQRKMFNDFMH